MTSPPRRFRIPPKRPPDFLNGKIIGSMSLSTPQCSSGTSQSRPFPARPAKILESAGQLATKKAVNEHGQADAPKALPRAARSLRGGSKTGIHFRPFADPRAWQPVGNCAYKRIIPPLCLLILTLSFSGCAEYAKTGPWAPNGVNYTLSRDRNTGELTDYFGVSWQLK